MMSLKSYLERKLAALQATRATASPNQEERRQHLTASVIAEGGSGVRRVRIRDFQIITDAGPAMAGYDLGPRAPEVLLGALGSCVSHTILIQAALQGIPIDSLVVDVSADVDSLAGHADVFNPIANIAYEVKVESSAPVEQFERINAMLPEICPVLNVVQFPQTVTANIVHNGSPVMTAAD
jgi:uncharacterized OsmC-like protein